MPRSGICFSTQLEDSRVIVLSSWSIVDEDEEIGQEVMALTDQDGFIPGQIYYCAMPELRNKHGEFITGWVEYHLVFMPPCNVVWLESYCFCPVCPCVRAWVVACVHVCTLKHCYHDVLICMIRSYDLPPSSYARKHSI